MDAIFNLFHKMPQSTAKLRYTGSFHLAFSSVTTEQPI